MISRSMTSLPYDDGGLRLPYPSKIIAVHLNFRSRASERGRTPEQPSYFLKPVSSLAPSGSTVERPAGTELLAFEGEIALVIKESTRRVKPEQAWSRVAGVTAANDLGVYDLRYADKGSNLRSKGGDGFTPVGPALIPADQIDPRRLRIRTWVNDALVQQATTDDLIFDFARLVADLSQLITLDAGDLILTGTPAGASVIKPGDRVEIEVDAPDVVDTPSSGRLVTTVTEGAIPLAEYGAGPRVDEATRADAWGNRAARSEPVATRPEPVESHPVVLTAELIEALRQVGTATLSSQLRRRGLNNVSIDGVIPLHPDQRLIGTARTLRLVPYREDLFKSHGGGFNAQKRAIDTLGSGEVLIIEARGERATGTIGDILALRAKMRGAAGVVTDGGIRDHDAVAEIGLPVFHAGAHPAVLGRRHVPWDVDQTIACGGTTVQPGDVIVGDSDGVLVIPPVLINEVVADAIEQERQETFIAEQVAAGASVDGLYPMNEQWKERYDQWQPPPRPN